MTTIDEASKSHEFNRIKNGVSPVISKQTINSFKAAVIFSEQFIDVNNEIPEIYDSLNKCSRVVLAKSEDYANEICAYFDGVCGFWRVYPAAFKVIVTHWRPITRS